MFSILRHGTTLGLVGWVFLLAGCGKYELHRLPPEQPGETALYGATGDIRDKVPGFAAAQANAAALAARGIDPLQVRPFWLSSYVRPQVNAVAFSPTGGYPVLAMDNRLFLWGLDGTIIRTVGTHEGMVRAAVFSPDGKQILSGGDDGAVRLFSVDTGNEIRWFQGHAGPVLAVAFSPDGRLAISGGKDGTVRVWDISLGREIWELQEQFAEVTCVAVSADGRAAAAGGTALGSAQQGALYAWDPQVGRLLHRLNDTPARVTALAFTPDGQLVSAGDDQMLRIWDPRASTPLRVLPLSARPVIAATQPAVPPLPLPSLTSLSALPTSHRILAAWDVRLAVLDLETGQAVWQVDNVPAALVTASPDGRQALSCGGLLVRNYVALWTLP